MKLARVQYLGQLPYMLLQPRLKNSKECRVVCLKRKAQYIADINVGSAGLKFGESKDIMKFAERAVNTLRKNCPQSITDGLVRVDVMSFSDGRFVVNEFESLEANFNSKVHGNELKVNTFLMEYWSQKINTSMINLI